MKKSVYSTITALVFGVTILSNSAFASTSSIKVSKAALAALKVSLKPSQPNLKLIENLAIAVLKKDATNLPKIQEIAENSSEEVQEAINNAIETTGVIDDNDDNDDDDDDNVSPN